MSGLVADHEAGELHLVVVARGELGESRAGRRPRRARSRARARGGGAVFSGASGGAVVRDGEDRGEHHAEHAAEVGDGVADDRQLGLQLRQARGQRRGVGERPGVDAGEHRAGQTEQVAHAEGDGGATEQQHDDRGEDATSGAQRGEERRAGGDADGVGEQHEAELADHGRELEALVVRRHREGEEQDGGRSEGEPPQRDRADRAADRHEDREQHQRVRCEQVGDGSHDVPHATRGGRCIS